MNTLRQKIKSYLVLMRFDKSVVIFLLLWPILWALWLAAQGVPSLKILLIFIIGAGVMRPAGCIINDIADRNFDRHVERTRNRPLATGEVSVKEALILFFTLCLIGLILVLQLNPLCWLIAVIALGLSCIYPLMKRITYLPQVVLGAAWNLGILMAFAAVNGNIPVVAWLLYIATIIWTVVYDTIYAIADRRDDLQVGIKSSAILFGEYDQFIIGILQIVVLLLMTTVGCLANLGIYYYLSLAASAFFFAYQHYLIKDYDPKNCIQAFKNNHWIGLIVFIGLALSY